MGGIYIHIPFCRKACVYCDFHFSTNLSRKTELVEAIAGEIKIRSEEIQALEVLHTLYLGGGTPSVLEVDELKGLLNAVQNQISFHPEIEITLEANPDDLSKTYLSELFELGINRLSIGIQSFSEEILTWMNRSHTAAQSLEVIRNARQAGFSNFSADLIFGNPGTTQKLWEHDLETLLAFKPPHISVYALTVEEKTVLAHQVQKDSIHLPEDEVFQEQFLQAHDTLTQAGYEHYELSNYALPGYKSKHNTAYWQGISYVGLGPSAHSFGADKRSWNHANNAKYIALIKNGNSAVEEIETLQARDLYHEYLMTHLRKASGIDLEKIENLWIKDWQHLFQNQISDLLSKKLLLKKGQNLSLTPKGWLLSDHIIREFFIDQIIDQDIS